MSILHEIKGWHSRGYLPHFDAGEVPQTITFRLTDSLPYARLQEWREELRSLPLTQQTSEYRRRVEAYLDRGNGAAWLRDTRVARLVEDALLYFDGSRYRLHSWVVMPNHVHALITPAEEESLSAILHSWKSFTSKGVNRLLGRRGTFWQTDYFDSFARHERQFAAVIEYIEDNPVKAGLCRRREDWPFSSARLRLLANLGGNDD
jgi:REP element-mobilizing transposase RayT